MTPLISTLIRILHLYVLLLSLLRLLYVLYRNHTPALMGRDSSIRLSCIDLRGVIFYKYVYFAFSNKNNTLKTFVNFCCPALYATPLSSTLQYPGRVRSSGLS